MINVIELLSGLLFATKLYNNSKSSLIKVLPTVNRQLKISQGVDQITDLSSMNLQQVLILLIFLSTLQNTRVIVNYQLNAHHLRPL